METGREDRLRLITTAVLVVAAAVIVATGGELATPEAEREALEVVRSTEPLVAGVPFAVAGDRDVSLVCAERCQLLVSGPEGARTILLPPGPIDWRPELRPVPSPDGRWLAFTLVQDGIPRTAAANLEDGTLLVRSTSFLDEDRLDELRWDESGRSVAIPRVLGDDLLWTVATPGSGESGG